MVNLNVEFDKKKYSEIMRQCSLLANEAEINKAINRAAKRAADTAKAETTRQLTGIYTLPASEIRGGITTWNTGGDEVGAKMIASSRPPALSKFKGVTPKEVMPPAKGPVQAQTKKGGGGTLKQAFIAKMKSGHIGVFEREGEKNLPIKQFFGPSVAGMFRENESVKVAVMEKTMESFDKRVQHELERLLNG
jgi:hypothetical protein